MQAHRPTTDPFDNGAEGVYRLGVEWHGDSFDIDIWRSYVRSGASGPIVTAELKTEIRYAGGHPVDQRISHRSPSGTPR